MLGFTSILIALILFAVVILIMRLFGAWMLRINEVIKIQKETLEELRKK
ncbi:hypothetical protein KCTC32516_01791 [Polaribacter huanghezhanensis]|nr:hypothetical protein [Polaribacter huanghezhanensis]WKD86416.1 hypothetical protein KCTC32516_01791 [Polaribacter huanghezhanensis]